MSVSQNEIERTKIVLAGTIKNGHITHIAPLGYKHEDRKLVIDYSTKDVNDTTKTVRIVNDLNIAIKDFERTTFETIKEVSYLKYEIELNDNEISSLKSELSIKDKTINKLQTEKEKLKTEL